MFNSVEELGEGWAYSGKGANGVVFVRDNIAVRVGELGRGEEKGRRAAAEAGIGPKVFGIFRDVHHRRLPKNMLSVLAQYNRDYGLVDVLIQERAIPARTKYPTNDFYSRESFRGYRALRKRLEAAGLEWDDDHTGNLGYIKNKAVVLDGIYA